jgi:hypothetical protein
VIALLIVKSMKLCDDLIQDGNRPARSEAVPNYVWLMRCCVCASG